MKDKLGHGSNARGTGTAGMRLVKSYTSGSGRHTAKVYKNTEWGEHVVKFFKDGVYQRNADSHTDDPADAHSTAQYQLKRYDSDGGQVEGSNRAAAAALASGAKSSAAPIHDSMGPARDMAVSDVLNRAIKASPTGHVSSGEAHRLVPPMSDRDRAGRAEQRRRLKEREEADHVPWPSHWPSGLGKTRK